MALRRDGTRLVLSALDRGPGFDWQAVLPANAWSESGRGLFLIETLGRGARLERLPGYGAYLEVTLVE